MVLELILLKIIKNVLVNMPRINEKDELSERGFRKVTIENIGLLDNIEREQSELLINPRISVKDVIKLQVYSLMVFNIRNNFMPYFNERSQKFYSSEEREKYIEKINSSLCKIYDSREKILRKLKDS